MRRIRQMGIGTASVQTFSAGILIWPVWLALRVVALIGTQARSLEEVLRTAGIECIRMRVRLCFKLASVAGVIIFATALLGMHSHVGPGKQYTGIGSAAYGYT